jgi:hypothetical protein
MTSIQESIRKFALLLVLADVTKNIKEAWEKSGQDIEKFKRMVTPFINRYLGEEPRPWDYKEISKAITTVTDKQFMLSENKKPGEDKWTITPTLKKPEEKPDPVKTPGI